MGLIRSSRRFGRRTERQLHMALAGVIFVVVGVMCAGVAWISSDPLVLPRSAAFLLVKADGGDFRQSSDVVRQESSYDCGPAALVNFLRALGADPIPGSDSIEVLAGTTPVGTKLSGLAEAAYEVLGFAPTLERFDPAEIGAGVLPLIAWFDQTHFVVVESQERNGRFTIVDPLLGRYVLSQEALSRRWTGEALWVPPHSVLGVQGSPATNLVISFPSTSS